MLKIITVTFFLIVLLYFTFHYLLKQSKEPAGFIGKLMMLLWNKAYLPMVDWSLKHIKLKEYPQRLLDIGIGNGASTLYLQEMFPNSKITGIDISNEAIKQAGKKVFSPSVTLSVQNIEHTSFEDQSFDFICAFQNHFHWQKIDKAFTELHRILAPQGIVLIACEYSKISYFLPNWKQQASLKAFLTQQHFVLNDTKQFKGWVYYEISPQ